MTRGLIIGKFMPIHQGHIALIAFGASHCDELIVSMSCRDDDPIAAKVRFSWLTEIFAHHPTIKLAQVKDDFDDESLALSERTRIWSEVIRHNFPPIHVLFSSEPYGDPLAAHLHVLHQSFDPGRVRHPVSATAIRKDPFKNWDFIPIPVRPYFVKKVCFYGPESTGKSTMTLRMAEHYQTAFVPEVAREMITSNDFTAEDIIRIGQAYRERVIDKMRVANRILFCDTDLITTQIYSNHYLGTVPPVLYVLEEQLSFDHYFLFDIDTPWVADGLRDLENQREAMFLTFQRELEKRKITYTLLSGTWNQKFDRIRTVVDSL